MLIPREVWEGVVHFFTFVVQKPLGWHNDLPQPLLPGSLAVPEDPDYPVFKPPSGRLGSGHDAQFVCEYPDMVGWESCSTPNSRDCWLRHKNGSEFNIHTDYVRAGSPTRDHLKAAFEINTSQENRKPQGIDRHYTLDIKDGWFNADGLNFTDAKLVNESYPGPWIQACWGDVSSQRHLLEDR